MSMLKKIGITVIVGLMALLLYAQTMAHVQGPQDVTAKVDDASDVQMSVKKIKDPKVTGKAPVNPDTITADMFDGACGHSPFTIASNVGYELVQEGCDYHFYMSDSIGSVHNYEDMIRGLKALPAGTKVVLHLANFGGYVHTGVQIVNAMKASKAHVVAEVEGPSYSMGALIACAADELKMHPYTFLMFHDFSGGFQGKGSESRDMIDAFHTMTGNLMRNECKAKGVLDDSQIKRIQDGTDIYIHSSDL